MNLELITGYVPVQVEEGFNDCWVWCGKMNRNGYGRLTTGQMAHREMYEFVTGLEIPYKHVLDHKCRVRSCVNPAHLEPVTIKENTLRGKAKLFGRDIHPRHYHKEVA